MKKKTETTKKTTRKLTVAKEALRVINDGKLDWVAGGATPSSTSQPASKVLC